MSLKRSFGHSLYAAILILILIIIVLTFSDIVTVLEESRIQCADEFYIHKSFEKEDVKNVTVTIETQDNFIDLVEALHAPRDNEVLKPFQYVIIKEAIDHHNPSFADIEAEGMSQKVSKRDNILEQFQWSIRKKYVYKKNDPTVAKLLNDMATLPIVGAEEKSGGTEIKLTIEFPDEMFAIFKPMRFPRNKTTDIDHFHFQDYERHHSEIASFHLDRLLGFYRVLPAVGRVLDMKTEIFDLCEKSLHSTFFTSEDNNTCFFGTCMIYCDLFHPVCGKPDKLEGSLVAYLPQFEYGKRQLWMHPWKRSYAAREKAEWEDIPDYCETVRSQPIYKSRSILDLMDLSIFDFLIGNADRHSYQTFKVFGNDSSPVIYDNGRGFGRPFYDDYLTLAPVMSCCLLRETTLKTLLKYHNGPVKMSQALNDSLKEDPLESLLWDPHLKALDRRIKLILIEIRKCISKHQRTLEKPLKESSSTSI